jgi:hypothetical protein
VRPKYSLPFLAAVLALSLAQVALAQQSAEKKPPKQQSYLRIVQYVVPPGKANEFQSVARQVVEHLAESESTASFVCMRSQQVVFSFILPMDSIEDRARQTGALIEAGRALGDEWARQAADSIDYMNEFLVIARPDLSYVPKTPRLTPAETRFMHFDFHYLNFGTEAVAESTAKEYAALHKKVGCDTGFTVYEVVGGTELPILILATPAKDIADFYVNRQRVLAQLGPDVAGIAAKRDSVIRRIEQIDSTVLPQLSYQPPAATAD